MATLRFNDLNLDIKKKIVDYITRPEDLKTLCLTSKALQDIATPPLYKKMSLFIGGHRDVRISGLISRTNPGIQHIRKVSLQIEKTVIPSARPSAEESDDSSDEESEPKFESIVGAARQAQFTVRLLIDFLPDDILESFRYGDLFYQFSRDTQQVSTVWQNWEPFSIDNWVLLMKKQKRLKAVEIASVDRPFMPVLEKQPNLLKDLACPKSLHFYPDSLDRLQACQKLLEAQPNISEIQLSSGFHPDVEIPEGLHDTSTRPGLMSRTIFSHFLPFQTCSTPMTLKKLTIDNVDLRYAADTYMRFIRFGALESFVVGGCPGADAVFSQMSKPHLRPAKLKKLRWFHEANEPHVLEAFEGLLEAITGLEVLHVDTNNIPNLPKAAAITHHGKTLRVLGVRSRMEFTSISMYESEQFEQICDNCLELRQLGITFPTTSVSDYEPSPEFTTYLRFCRKLRHLTTVNLHRWPLNESSISGRRVRNPRLKPQWYEYYEHNLQHLAQQIFEASDSHFREQGWGLGHRSMLAVIAFGANGKTPFDNDRKILLKQIPFVRGLKIDAFGKLSMLAVKTLWKMVQFIEPESDVLNHSLYDLHDVHASP